jgi:heme exporter protein C
LNKAYPRKSLIFTVTTVILMLAAFVMIFVYAPEEKSMGEIQRVFYLHVPLAWISLLAFLVIFISSIMYLAKENIVYDNIARASAKIGLIFNTLMLISGSVWAKAVWGVWWTWDPRLTTSLILWFIYIGYLLVRNAGFEEGRGARFAPIVGIIGFADVPVIALSTTLWQTQHPSEIIFQGGLTVPMLVTLMVCVVAFTLLYALLMTLSVAVNRMEGIILEMESHTDFTEEEG